MPINILMPALSPTMTEGNLAKWHKKEGDAVAPGDLLAEIETDKATLELESVDEGVLARILVPEGAEGIPINQVIAMMLEEGEEESDLDAAPAPATVPQAAAPAAPEPAAVAAAPQPVEPSGDVAASPLARRMASLAKIDLGTVTGSGAHGRIVRADVEAALAGTGAPGVAAQASAPSPSPSSNGGGGARVFASPLARRMASQAGLDLAAIAGSGPDGRVIKIDVEAALAAPAQPQAAAASAPSPAARAPSAPAAPSVPIAPGEASAVVKMSTMRKVIAERMTQSKTTVPHFYLTVDCEIDELLKVRRALNERGGDVKISVNDFVIRACALALMEVPAANVSYEGDGMMRHYATADVSVAVAIEGGLITPIVRGAEAKGLAQISADMKDLAARARDGKLAPEEYQGGSFSISNLGMFGVKQFDAVINPPQACILAVGAGEQRPVVSDGEIVAATVMSCTLSVDHRAVDGAIGAQLLAAIKRFIEYPPAMLL